MSAGLRRELIRLLGLHSDANQYIAPDGALSRATNVWLARPGLIQKRRGFTRWSGTLTSGVNKLFGYEGGLIAHCGTNALRRIDSNGVVNTISGGYTAPAAADSWRTRACIAGKNFYFNTDAEVYRLSGTSATPVAAGGLIATNLSLALTGASGFLADGYSVAYRYCIGSTDNFGRDIIGPVSGRVLIANAAGGARNTTVTVNLPSTATEANFIRVYRSEAVANGSQPDDDLKLVYEAQLKSADISTGTVAFTDIVTEALRGAFIYTAPNAGQGLLQNNEPPPFAAELVTHKNRVWYANTRRRSEYVLQLLAVGGTNGVQNGDVLLINGAGGVVLTANTGAAGANQYHLETGGTAAYNIEQTALNLVAAINARSTTNTIVWARYISAPNDVPGRILIFSRSVADSLIYSVVAGAGSKRDCWNPSMLPGEHIMDLSRTANVVTATVTSGTQSFQVGEQITVQGGSGSGGSVFGNGPFTVATIDTVGASTFITYAETGANGTLAARSVNIYTDDIAAFTQESRVNRIYFSKLDEFEAVPILNYLDVGRQDSAIIACISSDDQLWVFKRDGIFRIVGDDEDSFQVIDVDLTVVCNARETVVKFNGKPCALTNKGFVRVTALGVELLSWQIQKDILAKFVSPFSTILDSLAFAVPYDSEGLLMLFFGGNKDITSEATVMCNDAFVFNDKPSEWTFWQWDIGNANGNGKRCGVVNPADDSMYFGDVYATGASSTYVYKERKARSALDYRDQRGDGVTYGITSYVAPVLQTARSPGIEKLWQEVALLFNGSQPASMTVDDGNEWGAGGTHTIVPGASYVSRIWPYPNASRGSVLTLLLTHDTAAEAMDLAGIQVVYEPGGPEVSR